MWKDKDYTRRDSFASDEIVFVEETEYLGDSDVNVRPPVNADDRIHESIILSEDSNHNDVEYDTRLETLSDCVSSVSSRAEDINFADYFNAQCGRKNPIRIMLNEENSQSEAKYDWKEFFPSATLCVRENQRQSVQVTRIKEQYELENVNNINVEVIPSEASQQSDEENIFCEISSLEAFGDLKHDKMRRKMSEGSVKMNGESVLVEEIDNARDATQSQTNALHQKKCKGHHLVRDSHNMRPKKTMHRMDSFNHIREGSVQSQAFTKIRNTLKKKHSNSIDGAVLPTSNVLSERQRQPSLNQNDFIGNYIKAHHNNANEIQQAVIDTAVVVEMSKTERDVEHHPRSQSIYGDIVHQPSG